MPRGNTYFMVGIEGGIRISEFGGFSGAELGELLEYREGGVIERLDDVGGYLNAIEKGIAMLDASLIRKTAHRIGNESADNITKSMSDKIVSAAHLLIRKLVFSSPILVRFHNDADGTGGALSVHAALKDVESGLRSGGNIVWIMQRGVSYSAADAGADILLSNNYSCLEKPLLILVDFGTTSDSNLGIEAIRDRFDVIWLDHHPPSEGFEGISLEHYINPWKFGGNSNYTAGLLASAFCSTMSDANTCMFERASLIGDYSDYADSSWNTDVSTVLDFITSDPESAYGRDKSNVTPQEIEAVLNDRKRFTEMLHYANMRLGEALDAGMKNIRPYHAGQHRVYVLDFEDIRSEDSRYPLPGRFASKLLDRILSSGNDEAVLIVHAGPYISIRLSKGIGDRINLLNIINGIKGAYMSSVEAGGGHLCAAGIKVTDRSEKKRIISAIISSIASETEREAHGLTT